MKQQKVTEAAIHIANFAKKWDYNIGGDHTKDIPNFIKWAKAFVKWYTEWSKTNKGDYMVELEGFAEMKMGYSCEYSMWSKYHPKG